MGHGITDWNNWQFFFENVWEMNQSACGPMCTLLAELFHLNLTDYGPSVPIVYLDDLWEQKLRSRRVLDALKHISLILLASKPNKNNLVTWTNQVSDEIFKAERVSANSLNIHLVTVASRFLEHFGRLEF